MIREPRDPYPLIRPNVVFLRGWGAGGRVYVDGDPGLLVTAHPGENPVVLFDGEERLGVRLHQPYLSPAVRMADIRVSLLEDSAVERALRYLWARYQGGPLRMLDRVVWRAGDPGRWFLEVHPSRLDAIVFEVPGGCECCGPTRSRPVHTEPRLRRDMFESVALWNVLWTAMWPRGEPGGVRRGKPRRGGVG